MRIALISDVHANYAALEAVDNDAAAQAVEAVWFLGDMTGYGPEPAECIQWLSEVVHDLVPDGWVLGNHDAMLAELLSEADLADTNHMPLEAIDRNRQTLAADKEADDFWRTHFTIDRARPRSHTLDGGDFTLVHAERATGRYLYRYIYPWDKHFLADEIALLREQYKTTGRPQVQIFGHTHVPTLVGLADGATQVTPVKPDVIYGLGEASLVNPGSVGQPRDLNNRAAYAILDTTAHTVLFRRVPYDIGRTIRLMAERRYPPMLARRLMTADAAGSATREWLDHFKATGSGI